MRAVLVIDVLNGFCKHGNLASPRLARVIAPVARLLERELAGGAKVIFIADSHDPDDPEFEMFPPHCVKGSGEEEVVDELKPFAAGAMLIRKNRYSAFHGTELEGVLREIDPEEVVLVGVCTDICVIHTAADLRNRQYRVTLPLDCVETYDAPGHDADETNRFAVAHMRDVLGVGIVG
ncbi:MAG: isochorismatase family cysteine hydrolase [Actinomycetota bacterium]